MTTPLSRFFAAAACAVNLLLAWGPSVAAAPYEGAFFKRVNLVVADLDRSLKLYRDVLGFELDNITTPGRESYAYVAFDLPKTTKLRVATLSAGEEQVRTLALTELKSRPPARPGETALTASVIRVRDIAKVFWELESLGLETRPPSFVEGDAFDYWERAFVDFDGHLIVLYEIVGKP